MSEIGFLLNESYRDFNKYYRKGQIFGIISTYSGMLDNKSNVISTAILNKRLTSHGYTVIKATGYYKEDERECDYLIVFNTRGDTFEQFVDQMVSYGKRYRQNCVIVVDNSGFIWEIGTKPKSTIGGINRRRRLQKFVFPKVEDVIALLTNRTYKLERVLMTSY